MIKHDLPSDTKHNQSSLFLYFRKNKGFKMTALKEDIQLQVREKLRKEGIKLWLTPYFNESAPSISELKNLSTKYAEELQIPYKVCYEAVLQLQKKSLENLEQKKIFEQSGLATVKIKVLLPSNKLLVKKIMLSITTLDLKNIIQDDINIPVERMKLICSGVLLKDSESLDSQGVKNGHQLLAIILPETPKEVIEQEKQLQELENIKSDLQLLALDDDYVQLEDQFGNTIKVPKEERKALVIAMALHEKGKTAFRNNDYSKALLLFLEADQEFRTCNSELLKTVDNYALLDLDIAWCYLCLESLVHLPDANTRLKKCEEKLLSSYGVNLGRLIAVKGTPGNEEALLMRLHLLQAIVFYHQNKRAEALLLLRKVETEIKLLKVDEKSVTTLIELGYSTAEATFGLRATKGDLIQAANYIQSYREKRHESRLKAEKEHILEKRKHQLGLCDDGKQYVDPNLLKMLENMGYNQAIAIKALKKSNNIISDSIQYIQENPAPSSSERAQLSFLTDELAEQMVNLGFDLRMVKLALEKHSGDMMKAVDELISNHGIIDGDLSRLFHSASIDNIMRARRKYEEKLQAYNRFKDGITIVDDDYLDINLEQEEFFLRKYLSLLEM